MRDIKEVSITEENYPQLLRKIKNPPKKLYYLGKIIPQENCFAIVGTRLASVYGKEIAIRFAQELAQSGFTIVSGFAPGIDTFAHQACVNLKKRTIAVLGTGLEEKVIYPRSNLKLMEKILENGGCLISEFPPQTRGTKFTFPKRNRIIAGLSLGVLIVEAKEKSGALITAHFAFLEKRKVFAIPGSLFSENSRGCHLLIQKGAKLVQRPEDILQEFNIKIVKKENTQESEDKNELLILNCLRNGQKDLEEIVKITKLPVSQVLALVSVLEIKGKIKNLGGNIFSIS